MPAQSSPRGWTGSSQPDDSPWPRAAPRTHLRPAPETGASPWAIGPGFPMPAALGWIPREATAQCHCPPLRLLHLIDATMPAGVVRRWIMQDPYTAAQLPDIRSQLVWDLSRP